jgi:hypothetical protein
MKKYKKWPIWAKISLPIVITILLIGTSVTIYGYCFAKSINDDSNVYYSKKKSCGHDPYLATWGAELGSAQAALVTATQPNQENWLGSRGYYCSVLEAQKAGLYVISIDGQSVQPIK